MDSRSLGEDTVEIKQAAADAIRESEHSPSLRAGGWATAKAGGMEVCGQVKGTRLSAAVMFVRNLDKSLSFYRELLGLDVADQSSTAALLVSADGWQLVLRAFGENAPHPLGTIGVQYLLWTTASKADLDACEAALRRLSAYRETHSTGQDVSMVEGRDPDDLVVMLVYAADGKPPLHELPARIYAW
jgi:catechol 2,3-dioxygenase-like lactoylglutathione lyase family enzyme